MNRKQLFCHVMPLLLACTLWGNISYVICLFLLKRPCDGINCNWVASTELSM